MPGYKKPDKIQSMRLRNFSKCWEMMDYTDSADVCTNALHKCFTRNIFFCPKRQNYCLRTSLKHETLRHEHGNWKAKVSSTFRNLINSWCILCDQYSARFGYAAGIYHMGDPLLHPDILTSRCWSLDQIAFT